jgi:hypothetical protein
VRISGLCGTIATGARIVFQLVERWRDYQRPDCRENSSPNATFSSGGRGDDQTRARLKSRSLWAISAHATAASRRNFGEYALLKDSCNASPEKNFRREFSLPVRYFEPAPGIAS